MYPASSRHRSYTDIYHPPSMRFRAFVIVSLLAAWPTIGHAQTPYWEAAPGPYGGTIIPAVVRLDDGSFLAATRGGVFRSVDDGLFWTDISDGLVVSDVRALLVEDTGSVLAGTYGDGVYRLASGATSWDRVGLSSQFVTSLGETSSGNFLAGTIASLYRSVDNGATWQARTLEGAQVEVNAFASSSTHTFAVTSKGIYRSEDDGITWSFSSLGLQEFDVISVAVNERGNVFAGVKSVSGGCSIYRSRGSARFWTCIQPPTDPLLVPSIAFDDDGRLYAGGFRSLYRSEDEGDNWTSHPAGKSSINALAISGTTMIAGTYGYGIIRSEDEGITWGPSNEGVLSTVRDLLADDSGVLYVATDGGVFESADFGSTWARTGGDAALVQPVTSLILDAEERLVAGTLSGVWRFDSQTGWEDLGTTARPAIRDLALAPDGSIWAGYYDGVLRLDGRTWTAFPIIGADQARRDVAAVAIGTDGSVLAGAAWDSYRMEAGTALWNLMSTTQTPYFEILSFGQDSMGEILAGTRYFGVLKTEDNGRTWTHLDRGLTGREDIRTIAYDKTGRAHIGTFGSGVFQWFPWTGTWQPLNVGIEEHQRVLALAFDRHDNAYAGTFGGGLYRHLEVGSTASAFSPEIPPGLLLRGSYPNPASESVTIVFDLAHPSRIDVRIFDMLGRLVTVQAGGRYRAGVDRSAEVGLGTLAPGAYLYRVVATAFGKSTHVAGVLLKH